MTDDWQLFFSAQIAASAALLGLIFVGVSLNLTKILSFPSLPNRALLALMLLLAILVVSLLLLIPGQPTLLLAVEVLVVAVVVCANGFLVGFRSLSVKQAGQFTTMANIALTAGAVVPYLVAGLLLIAGNMDALFWIAAAMVLSTIKAVSDAWVLLVEINR